MYYAISVPLITTENMRFWPYSYMCFFGSLIFDGWPVCSYAHNASMKITFCVWTVNGLTFTPIQWRSEGGTGGGICPRAPPGGGRQNPDKEFFKIYILRNFEKSERIQ